MHDRSDETSVCSLEEKEEVMKLYESPELGNALSKEKYNLRKSLAWDNAFFTSAGLPSFSVHFVLYFLLTHS